MNIKAFELATRLRQAVQGCTLHLHGPVQAWSAIQKACLENPKLQKDILKIALDASTKRIAELNAMGANSNDQRVLKENKTYAFIERLLKSPTTVDLHKSPKLTVDTIILNQNSFNEVVLIVRKNPPYGWALPGGFVEIGETVEQAAMRETQEETNLNLIGLKLFSVYSDPQRDPRQHTASVVFTAIGIGELKAQDDAKEAKYFKLENLPNLAFDHEKILKDFRKSQQATPLDQNSLNF